SKQADVFRPFASVPRSPVLSPAKRRTAHPGAVLQSPICRSTEYATHGSYWQKTDSCVHWRRQARVLCPPPRETVARCSSRAPTDRQKCASGRSCPQESLRCSGAAEPKRPKPPPVRARGRSAPNGIPPKVSGLSAGSSVQSKDPESKWVGVAWLKDLRRFRQV